MLTCRGEVISLPRLRAEASGWPNSPTPSLLQPAAIVPTLGRLSGESAPMWAMNLARVCSLTDRNRARVLVDQLRQAGITSVFLPSDRALGVWDLEVPPDDVDRAQVIAGGTGLIA
jgi:hypothetical protein